MIDAAARTRLVVMAVALLFAAAALSFPGLRAGLLDPADANGMAAAILVESVLPRVVVALLAGAALGLSGSICQHILRNPLAEPTTLGVSAGAHLALVAAVFLCPGGLSGVPREVVAFAGAAGAGLLVFTIGWRQRLAPPAMIIAGLVVSLLAGGLSALATILHHDRLFGLSLWSTGALDQNGWSVALGLLPQLLVGLVATALLVRPLSVLGLDDDDAAVGLGLTLRTARLSGLLLATGLAAAVVSAVGVIGFLGLAAPWLAGALGARRFASRWRWATIFGALLLWAADAALQDLAPPLPDLPTGTATALLGSPLLLLVLRSRLTCTPPRPEPLVLVRRCVHPGQAIGMLGALLPMGVIVSLSLGRGPSGWQWASLPEMADLLPWRGPRLAAAVEAGAMIAAAGVLLQRVTGNGLASPEILGIAPGIALGVVACLLIGMPPDLPTMACAGLAGTAAVLLLLFGAGRRHAYAPEPMLLAGLSLETAANAVLAAALSSNDPRFSTLLFWAAGATDHATLDQVRSAALVTVAGLLTALPLLRWLEILPLGEAQALALGLDLARARLAVLGLAATLTTGGTLIIGPSSFVGLVAPHMARRMGFSRPLGQLLAAVVLGALVMLVADWIGRNLLFPYAIPAGLLAGLVGGPYLLLLMLKR